MKKILLFTVLFACVLACKKDDTPSDTTDDGQMGITDPQEVAFILNENLTVADGFTVDPTTVATTDDVIANSAAVGRMPVKTGIENVNTITFTPSAETGGNPVSAVGMRFGPTGDIIFREVTAEEAEAGIASFIFSIDPSVCEDIAQICHDIKCYEFAQTSSGAITQADLQDIAAVCAACDEPSCLDLLDEEVCENNGLQGASGNPRFNLTWTGGTDLDLYVTDPNGDTISYSNRTSPSGGALDVDCLGNCPGGNSENIFWENGGPSGTYSFYINYFSGSGPTPFTVTVFEDTNVISTHTGSVTDSNPDSATFQYVK
tara:strand:- start:25563 stop:26513 length:951 start_codon:yes stop_codon:yes gene_type:complete